MMNHFALLLICILSIEVLVYFNFFSLLKSILQVTKRVRHILPSKNISDHWKEVVIPAYSVQIMKYSMQILIILLCVVSLFLITDALMSGFLMFAISLIGVIESMVFAFLYFYIKNLVIKK
tara:strand:- start:1031 stop:1393 length:363 start_codon:yes stop_codon:yes gene_type:complete